MQNFCRAHRENSRDDAKLLDTFLNVLSLIQSTPFCSCHVVQDFQKYFLRRDAMDDREEAIEREKLTLEREKLKLERFKAWWTGMSVLVSVLIGATTIWFGVWTQRKTAELQLEVQRQSAQAQFEIKAAEIAMNTDNPDVTKGKSIALTQLFPNRLTPAFAKQFENEAFAPDEIASKKELLRLLATKPDQRAQIIKDWGRLFPGDQWIAALKQQ
jgi:hypothetical protein